MQIMTVEILNENAATLLKSLEKLNAIRLYPVTAKKTKKTNAKTRLSEKYRGAISKDLGEQMQQFIQQSRDEWQEPTF